MEETRPQTEEKIRRFSRARILEHWLAMLTVVILVVTGLMQKFYAIEFCQWLILRLGGIDTVRVLHRSTGVVFSAAMLIHIVTGVLGVLAKKWPPTMLIHGQDFRDAVTHLRYYVGLVKEPARCDRYDFKQKFDYWGILVGGLLMSLSGMILWFPIEFTRFLPGEIIPASKALHTNEALLLFVLIAVWHVYNAIFSPEVFPLDTSIFTGSISRERMEREHPLELVRIENAGKAPRETST